MAATSRATRSGRTLKRVIRAQRRGAGGTGSVICAQSRGVTDGWETRGGASARVRGKASARGCGDFRLLVISGGPRRRALDVLVRAGRDGPGEGAQVRATGW